MVVEVLYLQRTALPVSQLDPLSARAEELLPPVGPTVLCLHVKFILVLITEKDQNAQRFSYLCDALQWLCLKLIRWKSPDLWLTPHVIQTYIRIFPGSDIHPTVETGAVPRPTLLHSQHSN